MSNVVSLNSRRSSRNRAPRWTRDTLPLVDGARYGVWSKIRRDGTWGVIFLAPMRAGELVSVRRQNGDVSLVEIGSPVWTRDGVALYNVRRELEDEPTFADPPRSEARTAVDAFLADFEALAREQVRRLSGGLGVDEKAVSATLARLGNAAVPQRSRVNRHPRFAAALVTIDRVRTQAAKAAPKPTRAQLSEASARVRRAVARQQGRPVCGPGAKPNADLPQITELAAERAVSLGDDFEDFEL